MDDLISRQEAIDALEKMSANYGKKGRREWHPHIEECKSELRMLPPAQPEIIRCKDCDYWNERQGRMYCGEMYFDQDDPNFYCGYARRRTDE